MIAVAPRQGVAVRFNQKLNLREGRVDIVVWLQSLGLEQYAAAFGGNDITEAVLPELTAEDLKDLGVDSVGHPSHPPESDCGARRLVVSLSA
jgi:hypothetical protein